MKTIGAIRGESIKVGGWFNLQYFKGDKFLGEITFNNTVTTTGKAELAGLLNEVTSGGFKYIELGTGTTAALAANTALETPITSAGMARIIATTSRVTTTGTDDTARLVHTFTATATVSVTEIGVFDATSSGVMLARQTFSAKGMESADTLIATYSFKIG